MNKEMYRSNFTKLTQKKGISLIVLIVTIIVIIILAAVVILNISKNNPVESAKEARFKEDVRKFQDELALTVSKQYANAGGHRNEKISTSNFDKIKEYIPGFSKKYRDKFVIQDDELTYTNILDDKEKEYAQGLNVKKERRLLPDEYQQVEYIESTGTQYIDTKFSTVSGYRIKTSINISNWANGSVCYFAGFLSKSIYRDYTVIYQYKPMIGMSTDVQSSKTCSLNTWYDIDASTISKNGYFKLDGEELVSSSNTVLHDKYNIWLFGVNYYNTGKFWNCFAKIKETKIYNFDNVLVRNLIPCRSITTVTDVNEKQCKSETIGMYDTIEGKFYTNQGDPTKGDFIAGPDV